MSNALANKETAVKTTRLDLHTVAVAATLTVAVLPFIVVALAVVAVKALARKLAESYEPRYPLALPVPVAFRLPEPIVIDTAMQAEGESLVVTVAEPITEVAPPKKAKKARRVKAELMPSAAQETVETLYRKTVNGKRTAYVAVPRAYRGDEQLYRRGKNRHYVAICD